MKKRVFGLNKDIFLLGIVSFLTDVSSEAIFSVFSIFFTAILGASALLLGIVEGLADFAASSLDYVAGFISDKTGKRKRYALIGYSFSTLAKGILTITTSIAAAFSFRIVERLGKSFRGPPRDAWIASLAKKSKRGYAFGFHKALDKAGAVIGPFVAYGILSLYGPNLAAFKIVFSFAFIPAILSVFVLLFIKDKPFIVKRKNNFFTAYKNIGKEFKHYLTTASIFSLAYFSFGFLLLKAYLIGFSIKNVVLLYALFNLSFVIVSIPIGKIGDLIGRKAVIALGYILYLIMSIGFLLANSKAEIVALFVVFGIFYSIDEGQSKAYITDLEKSQRATAIGIYNFLTGLIYLPASLIAGYLWKIQPSYAFIFAAIISFMALLFFLFKKAK